MSEYRICIHYCTGCRWLMRAGWMAQELLSTFEEELAEASLRPGTESGQFDIYLNSQLLWSRKQQGRFPELKELKQLVRDQIAPEKTLGHSDQTSSSSHSPQNQDQD